MSQDESMYTFGREGKESDVRGVRDLRKETNGPRKLFSAFQSEYRGFGLQFF